MRVTVKLKNLISRIANRSGYRVERLVDYSDFQLDVFRILVEQFSDSSDDFFFVQVGANDGMRGDPIFDLVCQHHWRGVLIEPQPAAFAELRENYRKETQLSFENAAISESDAVKRFYTIQGSSYLGTFDRSALERRARKGDKIIEIEVNGISVETLVSRYQIKAIDLLVIDTEGFDYEIIKMMVGEFCPSPRLLRYEHLHLSSIDRRACAVHLASHGYKLLRDGTDTIAVLSSDAS